MGGAAIGCGVHAIWILPSGGTPQRCRWRAGIAIAQRGWRRQEFPAQAFRPKTHCAARRTRPKPAFPRPAHVAVAFHHAMPTPFAHPCWLTPGVGEGIAAAPLFEGMPAGGS